MITKNLEQTTANNSKTNSKLSSVLDSIDLLFIPSSLFRRLRHFDRKGWFDCYKEPENIKQKTTYKNLAKASKVVAYANATILESGRIAGYFLAYQYLVKPLSEMF